MSFAVVICTRNRPAQLAETLAALAAQTWTGFATVVVDQSDAPLAARDGVRVVPDAGRGLSRARNVGWRATSEPWLVYLDDDCVPEPGWAAALRDELAAHPDVAMVSGHVGPRGLPAGPDHVGYSLFPVERERTVSGRWAWPSAIGFGVCFAVRRDWVERLGGWDERFGPGVPEFPASDDMDFNWRLLRAGGAARLTPAPRAHHDQWRPERDIVALYGGYMASWAGFCVKQLKTGDVLGGLWLFSFALRDLARMAATGVKHRSRSRLRIAASKGRGLARGTRLALARSW